MRTLKASFKAMMVGLVAVAILIILDENGYGFFGFVDFVKSTLAF